MPKKKVVEEAKEEIKEEPKVEVVKEEPKGIIEEAQEALAKEGPTELMPAPALTETEIDALTEQKLLEVYEKSPSGTMLLGFVMVETGCHNMQKLSQAWDRLYNKGKVGFGKFYKP